MGGTLLSRLTGWLGLLVVNNAFAQGIQSAYGIAYRVPNLFRELLAEGALVNSFIPVHRRLDGAGGRALAGSLLTMLVAANLVVVGLGIAFAEVLTGLMIDPGSAVDRELATLIVRVSFPFLSAISFAALAMGLLQSEGRFFAPAFAPVALNAVQIVLMLLWPKTGLYLGLSLTAGGLAQLLFQLPALRRAGLLPVPVWPPHPATRQVLALMTPSIVTTGARQLIVIVAARILSRFPDPAPLSFYNSQVVFTLALGLFAVSPVQAYYPRMSRAAAAGDSAGLTRTVSEGLRLISFFLAPAGALILTLSTPLLGGLFAWTAGFTAFNFAFSVDLTWPLGWGLMTWGMIALLNRVFYVLGRIREAVAINASSFLVNVALYEWFSREFGLAGLGHATSVTGVLTVAALAAMLHADLRLDYRGLADHLARVVSAAALCGLVAWAVYTALPLGDRGASGLLSCLAAGGAGLVVYLAATAALRVPETRALVARLTGRKR
jgi:putative peptidoglycan lipid II flippase